MINGNECRAITLADAQINRIYRVTDIAEGQARRRLLDMGFTPAAEIYVSHKAPFGKTFLVGVRGFMVALREDAARLVLLEAAVHGV
ncbi:MAG: ferrous iron transport protein A [Firmicutes bacterium]|nr:ferrous iron transport protein A [Bacillota bacterium]